MFLGICKPGNRILWREELEISSLIALVVLRLVLQIKCEWYISVSPSSTHHKRPSKGEPLD